MKKLKSLCKVSKASRKKLRKDIIETVSEPKYICEKCLRVSAHRQHLCSPCALKDWQP